MVKKEDDKMEVFESIEDIPGVGPSTAAKLRELGYTTVEALATATINELVEGGISDKIAAKIISLARNSINVKFVSALEILKQRENIQKLTTGSKRLDSLLGGGLETMTITEFFGEFGTGKSQISHQLAVTVQLPVERGGLNGNTVYIDTENSFRPERIVTMAKHLGLDPIKTVENIIVAEAFNSDHQILIVERLDEIIKSRNIKLVVVDSLTTHFRSEYLGRESLVKRQQKLNAHLHRLERLSKAFNLVIVVTNQVMAKPDEIFGLGAYPIGGHILAHRSHTRVYLRKARGEQGLRVARLIVSLDRPEGECLFKITENGIEDVEEENLEQ
ncbi:MAG: DNA repair and recombination protein RadA [Nitrososphaerota archaeon]|nr:DNA repair and recombination protein RadA [Nitrososphaerota archaeon]